MKSQSGAGSDARILIREATSEGAREWAETGRLVLEALEASLPGEITILDSFLDLANEWGQRLVQQSGYRRVRLVHVYPLNPEAPLVESPAGCVEIQPENAATVAALHTQLFPNTYLTAQQIINAASAGGETTGKLYVYLEDSRVLGYVYSSENLGEGVVDFLGVDPVARHLYEQAGFSLLYTGVHSRKQR